MSLEEPIDPLKKKLTRDELLEILKKFSLSQNIIDHSIKVTDKALEIADKIEKNGHKVDKDLILAGSLLHDIGRAKKYGWKHGIEGAFIIRDMNLDAKIALIAERHILAGITKDEARQFGLPEIDNIPETLEEKIVAYADKLTKGSKYLTLDERFEIWKEKYGNTKVLDETHERAKILEKNLLELMNG